MGDRQYFMDIISGLAERTIKRLWIVVILLIVLLVATNGMWIYRERQFVDEVTETIEATSESGDAYGTIISGDGSMVNYGEGKGNTNQETSPQDGR